MGYSGTTFQVANEITLIAIFFWARLLCMGYQWIILSSDLLTGEWISTSPLHTRNLDFSRSSHNWSTSHQAEPIENPSSKNYVLSITVISFYFGLTGLTTMNIIWFPKL